MLIRHAEVWGLGLADVRIADGRITEIATPGALTGGIAVDAAGGALLPGLHDHHVHLAGLAAKSSSVSCGPPDVENAADLARQLRRPGTGWLRGTGYHESVMGLPTARELDAVLAERPLRIQHRSGRMWLLNTMALDELLARAEPPPGLERDAGGFTGRLFDEDRWLRSALDSQPPDLSEVSRQFARFGVTGVTDMSPRNDPETARHFARQIHGGSLRQQCWLAGELSLAEAEAGPWQLGPAKLHLHEAALPDFAQATEFIAAAHRQDRGVAVHCVSEVELVFAVAAFEQAGTRHGDRVEHASVASPALVERIAELHLQVCVQPHFIHERGDRYLVDVEPRHRGDLYRLRTLLDAGIALAGGSDAPFASADPWAGMAAAVARQTRGGQTIGPREALSPEEALSLYLAAPEDLGRQRRIVPGAPADLCLLLRPWSEARERLSSDDVRATIVSGRVVHDLVDEAPGKGMADG